MATLKAAISAEKARFERAQATLHREMAETRQAAAALEAERANSEHLRQQLPQMRERLRVAAVEPSRRILRSLRIAASTARISSNLIA